ncbi:hypothetical protein KSX_68150 [Ktedonospora formicarum]|uniref:Uncharacterized protein n=1 Tax=Ktedonospora formicarum TaxID=2778364 RepID=A0A8J3I9U4_9CHLR|nr:hypothetical protein KSX_68150 [Ktedonospora formicarum]
MDNDSHEEEIKGSRYIYVRSASRERDITCENLANQEAYVSLVVKDTSSWETHICLCFPGGVRIPRYMMLARGAHSNGTTKPGDVKMTKNQV